jgi:glycerol-3-phosphate dehydrogenase
VKRDVAQLANKEYDLLIVGGGIQGACVAWDATLRGLSVALVDKGDFGHATSANSLKTIHGGLRYLQDADLKLVRMMIHERMSLMKIVPHLVHPLPCLMPTYSKLMKSKPVMAIGLAMNDLLCLDRNRLSDPQKRLPRGRVISRQECLQILPGVASQKVTGGAIWHDAQMYSSERVTLSFILSAAQAGADVANYVEAIQFVTDGEQVSGIRAKDVLTGNEMDIRAKIVVNTAGPWVNQVSGFLNGHSGSQKVNLSIAMNLVTHQFISDYAAGVPSWPDAENGAKKSHMLFIAPWRNYSVVGTKHIPYEGHPEDYQPSEEEIQDFIDEVNSAYPGAELKREDVLFVHWGFLPAEDNHLDTVKLVRQSQVYDHQKEGGVDGLISIVSVKYTSAREVACRAVDLAFNKLGQKSPKCMTHRTPLYGGEIERFDDFLKKETAKQPAGLDAEVVQQLIYNYGSEYSQLLGYLDEDAKWGQTIPDSNVIKAQVLHAIREEMAQKLSDVVFRRTELGSAGHSGEAGLKVCVETMGAELGWSQVRAQQESDEVKAVFAQKT